MRHVPRQSVLASTLALALAAGPAPARSGPQIESPLPGPAPACSLSIFPEEVSAGRPDTRVLVETSERITGSPTADVPARSGIEVRDVQPDVSPDSWVLRLDLSGAQGGEWTIELAGRSVQCAGEISIQGSGPTGGRSVSGLSVPAGGPQLGLRPKPHPGEPERAVVAHALQLATPKGAGHGPAGQVPA